MDYKVFDIIDARCNHEDYSTFYLKPALYERIILGTRTDIWTESEPSIGYETSVCMALIIIPSSTVFLLFLDFSPRLTSETYNDFC